MGAEQIRIVPKDEDASVEPDVLAHLGDLDGFELAEGSPDIRGWKVVLPDGRKVGKVEDLIVDTTDMSVRYIEVKVDRQFLVTDDDQWMLVPIGSARLDDKDDVVEIDRLPRAGLGGAPRAQRGLPTREQERELRDYYEPTTRAAGGAPTAEPRGGGGREAR